MMPTVDLSFMSYPQLPEESKSNLCSFIGKDSLMIESNEVEDIGENQFNYYLNEEPGEDYYSNEESEEESGEEEKDYEDYKESYEGNYEDEYWDEEEKEVPVVHASNKKE